MSVTFTPARVMLLWRGSGGAVNTAVCITRQVSDYNYYYLDLQKRTTILLSIKTNDCLGGGNHIYYCIVISL